MHTYVWACGSNLYYIDYTYYIGNTSKYHSIYETRFFKISPNVTLKYAELHNSMFP